MSAPVLDIQGLQTHFFTHGGVVKAVDGVDLRVGAGEILGHLVLTANHPSPLSALRPPVPFIGCGHFSQAQAWKERRAANG